MNDERNLKSTSHKQKKINVSILFSQEEIKVGQLILDQRLVYFKYDDNFLTLGLNLSPFKVKYNNEIQVAPPDPFHGIFGLFDDSLPDGWGMLLLNRALGKQGLSLNEINILDQLAYIGENGKGALIYRPAINEADAYRDEINIDGLKTAIDKVYKGSSEDLIDELFHLGGSSGGARPKVNVGYNQSTGQLIHGITKLPENFEHWIIKFPSSDDPPDIANIEYAYYKMALLANIQMSDSRLLESKKGFKVFATKRFDRVGNKRMHMHSMAGLTHDNFRLSNIDYGHIMDVAYQLERTAMAREKILRLAAFNVYSHNRDDHSKNFSWLMDSTGNWTLAPAYDLTYSSTSIDEHITRIAGEGANPGRKHLQDLAKEFSVKKVDLIIEQVHAALDNWPIIAKECGVSKTSTERIQQRLEVLKD